MHPSREEETGMTEWPAPNEGRLVRKTVNLKNRIDRKIDVDDLCSRKQF